MLEAPRISRQRPGAATLKYDANFGIGALVTDPNQSDGDNRRGAIAGLVIAIVLLAVGIWLVRDLSAASKLQDCVMSGRTNCNTIEPAR